MSSHTQERPLSKTVVGSPKNARSANDPARGTVMAKALLNAFQFSKRKTHTASDSGKTKSSVGRELRSGQRPIQQKVSENIGSKLSGNLDITAVLSKAAGFPINLSCLSAFGDIGAPAIIELLRAASLQRCALKVLFIERAKAQTA